MALVGDMYSDDLACWTDMDDTGFVARVSDALSVEVTQYPPHPVRLEPGQPVWFSVETLANIIDEAEAEEKEVDG